MLFLFHLHCYDYYLEGVTNKLATFLHGGNRPARSGKGDKKGPKITGKDLFLVARTNINTKEENNRKSGEFCSHTILLFAMFPLSFPLIFFPLFLRLCANVIVTQKCNVRSKCIVMLIVPPSSSPAS